MMLRTDREWYHQVLSERKQKQPESEGRAITKINRFIAIESMIYKGPAVQEEDVALL